MSLASIFTASTAGAICAAAGLALPFVAAAGGAAALATQVTQDDLSL